MNLDSEATQRLSCSLINMNSLRRYTSYAAHNLQHFVLHGDKKGEELQTFQLIFIETKPELHIASKNLWTQRCLVPEKMQIPRMYRREKQREHSSKKNHFA